jgi:membrane-bound lytic murein transglycosylase A
MTKRAPRYRALALLLCALALGACASLIESRPPGSAAPEREPPVAPPPVAPPQAAPPPAVAPGQPPPISFATSLQPVAWHAVRGWEADAPLDALATFLRGCPVLKTQTAWQAVCASAAGVDNADAPAVREFFQSAFAPYRVVHPDGGEEGTVTGYYEPLLRGSRLPNATYRFPIYAVPDDLLVVELGELYPELKHMRLRGRLEGRRIVPYHSRADIETGKAKLAGRELLWVDNLVDLFFLQIQGSGKVELSDGQTVRVSYADQNGHPYRSIGRLLVERGELTLDQASMQGIKAWADHNPERLPELLNENASYVFFREVSAADDGPPGALGVPLTAGRSLAVDPRAIPLGAPVFLATTWPSSSLPLHRVMVAQDTGGAIKGAVRADFYWGSGPEAGVQAGRMRQAGRMWVLLPHGFPLSPQP